MELDKLYQDIVIEYSQDTSHKGTLASPDASKRGVNPNCGDDLTLSLQLDGDRIEKAVFSGMGCAISEASAAMMTELIEGKTVAQAAHLADTFIGMIRQSVTDEESLDALEDARALQNIAHMPARVKCAVLAWRTLREALAEYQEKTQRK